MKIIKKHLTNGQYIAEKKPIRGIILHHTAGGSASSAWGWWNQTPAKVGTPYIIDRNGDVIEAFDPEHWAWDLGLKSGDINSWEQQYVGIELVAWGQLTEKDGIFYNYLKRPVPKNEVCTLSKPYRNFTHYHKYTPAQIESLGNLIKYLIERFPTIKIQSNLQKIFEFNPKLVLKSEIGIYSHSTLRQDKNDVFPQPELVSFLKSLI